MTKFGLGFLLLAAGLLAAGCARNRFQDAYLSEVRVYERGLGKEMRTIRDPAALSEIVAILSRAKVDGNTAKEVRDGLWKGWYVDMIGDGKGNVRGRWLYDPAGNRVARMDIWSGKYVYSIQPQDQVRLRALLH